MRLLSLFFFLIIVECSFVAFPVELFTLFKVLDIYGTHENGKIQLSIELTTSTTGSITTYKIPRSPLNYNSNDNDYNKLKDIFTSLTELEGALFDDLFETLKDKSNFEIGEFYNAFKKSKINGVTINTFIDYYNGKNWISGYNGNDGNQRRISNNIAAFNSKYGRNGHDLMLSSDRLMGDGSGRQIAFSKAINIIQAFGKYKKLTNIDDSDTDSIFVRKEDFNLNSMFELNGQKIPVIGTDVGQLELECEFDKLLCAETVAPHVTIGSRYCSHPLLCINPHILLVPYRYCPSCLHLHHIYTAVILNKTLRLSSPCER